MLRLLVAFALACGVAAAGEPVRIIFDTDMGNDVDDALALAVLHALENRSEARILAVTITKDNRWSAPFVDLVNAFYGRPGIPIGTVRDGKTRDDGNYTRPVAGMKRPGGGQLYPRRITTEGGAPDAQVVLRKTLAAQPDASVVIVQTGFSTNLARLLDSRPDGASPLAGSDLVKRKVRMLVVMGGRFSDRVPEYNIVNDVPAARKLFAEWPTPVVLSGWEIGASAKYPAGRIESDFRYVQSHPIADAYKAYQKMPYDEPLWDPSAVLYAVRPEAGYFNLSPEGRVEIGPDGSTQFSTGGGRDRLLAASPEQSARIVEAVAALVSEPPEHCR
jgi:inosine-uridine nucleoside N-ribohydrolase